MSLRTKILWLFAIFAVVPILTVGVVDYLVSTRAIHEVMRQRAELEIVPTTGAMLANELAIVYEAGRVSRLLFVVIVVLITSVAFSILINRVMRSLGELTAAADAIGRGDFTPWLPPPGGDEVGRLSFAIGSMMEKIGQMLRQVEQNRQLAVVGEFASYLAHEIRNPLSSLKLNLQGVAREVRGGQVSEQMPQILETCVQEINRLDRVVQAILRFGRTESETRTPCSIHEVLGASLDLVGMQLTRRGIRVEVRRQADDDLVLASAEELKSVLLNLLLNAADAMPEGGRLRIWTHNEVAHDDRPAVWVHIADDGAGISPELRDRIFDPFFTTKREGSGIGLSLALRTLRHHGGELSFEKSSEIEPGAEFIIRLPLLENGSGGFMTGIGSTTILTDGEELAALAMTDLNDGVITS